MAKARACVVLVAMPIQLRRPLPRDQGRLLTGPSNKERIRSDGARSCTLENRRTTHVTPPTAAPPPLRPQAPWRRSRGSFWLQAPHTTEAATAAVVVEGAPVSCCP